MGDMADDSENDAPLETDPTGRYQRCDEVLGEGAYKLVYRACDLEEGNEVAWNQLRFDHLSRREAQKILSEIEILQSIRNDHIINFYASWSTPSPNVAGGERIVFITELMSSGTLKQYLKKTLKGALKPKVLKSWCRQILLGLAYMHTHQPPIIHRDLKCDNIFINGNNGQLKIGDLGLAVVRHRTHVSSVLGTPEFMAPELYDEKYDEKIDIYAFGMCVLEMVSNSSAWIGQLLYAAGSVECGTRESWTGRDHRKELGWAGYHSGTQEQKGQHDTQTQTAWGHQPCTVLFSLSRMPCLCANKQQAIHTQKKTLAASCIDVCNLVPSCRQSKQSTDSTFQSAGLVRQECSLFEIIIMLVAVDGPDPQTCPPRTIAKGHDWAESDGNDDDNDAALVAERKKGKRASGWHEQTHYPLV